jgi:hypothetical protein
MRARLLIGVFAIVAPGGPLTRQADDPPTADDALSRQVDADVAAIVAGMAFAHRVRAVVVRLPQ